MPSVPSSDPVVNILKTIETLENEHRWYASAFDWLKAHSSDDSEEDFRKKRLNFLVQTRQAVMGIIPFHYTAFYFCDSPHSQPCLEYCYPDSSAELFQTSVKSWISENLPEGRSNWKDFRFFSEGLPGEFLVLEPVGNSDSFFGMFVGIFHSSEASGVIQGRVKEISSIMNKLAEVLLAASRQKPDSILPDDFTAMKSSHSPKEGEAALPIPDRPPAPGGHSALHDMLTDLPGRILVEDRVKMALAHARYSGEKVAVLILDIDNFKRMNDFLGISAGDRLLKGVAQRIRSCLREEDTLGRNGGDEFIILLPDIHLIQDIEYRVERIFERLKGSFDLDGQEVHAGCSVGIAVFPDDGENAASLVKAAKAAMYQAKEEGKDRFCFFRPHMFSRGYLEMNLEGALRKALEREEFHLHFQPKISIQDGSVQGMEALLRWKHPSHGWVVPSDFIPMAEELGLIQPIGEWVLLNTCRQIRAWKRAGFPPIRIAVNLSGYQVNQIHWMSKVKDILLQTGVDPSSLEVEITETVLMGNSDVALANLQEMDQMGIRISIDDFGTGYSSLSYLKRFPIHALKIDRSFVRGIYEKKDGADAVITKAIVSLARALNLKTVAEGVERVEEKEYLESIGCDDMQGYLFSRPRPVEQINYMFTRKLGKPVRVYHPDYQPVPGRTQIKSG